MRVNDIRDRIVELSHHGAGPDGEMNARALTWLNSAYQQLLDELMPYAPPLWQQQETPTVATDGTLTLAQPVHRLLRVYQGTQALEIADPLAALDGRPCVYLAADAVGRTLVAPQAVGQILTVLYLPEPTDLVDGGAESTILLPRTQHSGLIWGGLVWSALFERGFTSAANLAVYQALWQEARQRTRLALLGGIKRAGIQEDKTACNTVDKW